MAFDERGLQYLRSAAFRTRLQLNNGTVHFEASDQEMVITANDRLIKF
jgi:hypothetical protein